MKSRGVRAASSVDLVLNFKDGRFLRVEFQLRGLGCRLGTIDDFGCFWMPRNRLGLVAVPEPIVRDGWPRAAGSTTSCTMASHSSERSTSSLGRGRCAARLGACGQRVVDAKRCAAAETRRNLQIPSEFRSSGASDRNCIRPKRAPPSASGSNGSGPPTEPAGNSFVASEPAAAWISLAGVRRNDRR